MDGLPDELLISIVSLLSLNEAARTSVLTRRWRNIWSYNRILNFDDGSEMVHELEKVEYRRKRFVEWVKRVVSLHSGETIDEFRVRFNLDNNNGSDIDRWIEFALRKRAKKLELNFESITRDGSTFSFKQNRYQFLEDQVVYSFPNVNNLGVGVSLVSLSLTRVDLTDEILDSFMSNCPTLEDLHLENANGLKIFAPSFQATRLLRRLALIDCKDLKRIEICSPNLVSYALSALTHTVLNGVSSLIHLSLGAFVFFELLAHLHGLFEYLSRLETLTLHTTALRGTRWMDCPSLPRLNKLVLQFDINEEARIPTLTPLMMNAAPLLREIVLMLIGVPCDIYCSRPPKLPDMGQKHECLKVLEIVGYAGITVDVEMALYVLEYAVSLEKVVIDGVANTGEGLHLLKRNLLAIAAAQDSSVFTRRTIPF